MAESAAAGAADDAASCDAVVEAIEEAVRRCNYEFVDFSIGISVRGVWYNFLGHGHRDCLTASQHFVPQIQQCDDIAAEQKLRIKCAARLRVRAARVRRTSRFRFGRDKLQQKLTALWAPVPFKPSFNCDGMRASVIALSQKGGRQRRGKDSMAD